MIIVTKLDGNKVLLNVDNIKYIEAHADTIVHYINGDTLIVKEKLDQLDELLVGYHRKVFENEI